MRSQLGKFVQTSDQGNVKKDKVLSKIFRTNQLRGGLFEKGMYDDLVGEGWDDPAELRTEYKPVGEEKQRLIDGVVMVTSSVEDDILNQVQRVSQHFLDDGVVSFPLIRQGTARPDEFKGREQYVHAATYAIGQMLTAGKALGLQTESASHRSRVWMMDRLMARLHKTRNL